MANEIVYRLFTDRDASAAAAFFNRARYYIAEHKHITADDFLYVQQRRGTIMAVVACRGDDIVGFGGAYRVGDQMVMLEHQIYVGTFIVDSAYRLSGTAILGLYDVLMQELAKLNCKELVVSVFTQNIQSAYLVQKYGFVQLQEGENAWGGRVLHNYMPALMAFPETADGNISTASIYNRMPVVDKKAVRKGSAKQILHDRFIECEYISAGRKVFLLFDIVNHKVDGVLISGHYKLYPDFAATDNVRYVVEHLGKPNTDALALPYQLVDKELLPISDGTITLQSGETAAIDCPPNVERLRIFVDDAWYLLYPNKYTPYVPHKGFLHSTRGNYAVELDKSSGFIKISGTDGATLATAMWPCLTAAYIEGADIPRIKDLTIGKPSGDLDGFVVKEDTDEFCLTRICTIEDGKLTLRTMIQLKKPLPLDYPIEPTSQLLIEYKLTGGTYNFADTSFPINIKAFNKKDSGYVDVSYWDVGQEQYAGHVLESIDFAYQKHALAIVTDKSVKYVLLPRFVTSYPAIDSTSTQEQQLEYIEIFVKTEE